MVGDRRRRRRRRPDQHRLQGRVPPPPARRLGRAGAHRRVRPGRPGRADRRRDPVARARRGARRRRAARSGRRCTAGTSCSPPTRGPSPTSARATSPRSSTPAAPPGLSKGCMLSHAYHGTLSRQIGICWRRTADDVVWTPLPLFHFNAIVTAVLGLADLRRPGRDLPAVLGVELLVGDEPGRRHRHLHARHDGVPPRQRHRPARAAAVGRAGGQHLAAAHRRRPAAGRDRPGAARALRRRHLLRRLRRHRGVAGVVAAARASRTGRTRPA